jgi:hypothetical protein
VKGLNRRGEISKTRKYYLISFLFFALLGCNLQNENDPNSCGMDTEYNYETEVASKTGLVLQVPANDLYITFGEIEQYYGEMQSCTGMTAPAPKVWATSFKERGLGGGWGAYLYAHQIVMLNTDENIVPRDCISDRQSIKHEFVHHILYMNGQDASHGNPLFAQCATGVNVCDGKPC